MAKLPHVWPTVPRLCPGGTVAIFAGGPTLTQSDIDYCRDKVQASIAVNNSYKLAPWATALYAADRKWWLWHKGAPSFPGLKYSLSPSVGRMGFGVQVLKNSGRDGLDPNPSALRHGYNGSCQAVNLAVHFGAKRIVLLGVDMQPLDGKEHWHGDHPSRSRSPYKLFLKQFAKLVNPLTDMGVEVINCSPRSALECFPKQPLREALC